MAQLYPRMLISSLTAAAIAFAPNLSPAQETEEPPVCIKDVNGTLTMVPGPCPETLNVTTINASPTSAGNPVLKTGAETAAVGPTSRGEVRATSDSGPETAALRRVIRGIANNSNEAEAMAQFESIVAQGSGVVPAAQNIFLDRKEEPTTRWVAGRILGRLPTASSEAALVEALDDKVSMVRIAAVKGLQDGGHRSAVPALTRALNDKAAMVRAAILDALGTLGSVQDVPVVAKELSAAHNFMKGKGIFVRTHAASTLGTLGGPEAIEALISIADDANEDTRDAARTALLSLSGRTSVPAGSGSDQARWQAWWATRH